MLAYLKCFCTLTAMQMIVAAADARLRGVSNSSQAPDRQLTEHPPSLGGGLFAIGSEGSPTRTYLYKRGDAFDISQGNPFPRVQEDSTFTPSWGWRVAVSSGQHLWTLHPIEGIFYKNGATGLPQPIAPIGPAYSAPSTTRKYGDMGVTSTGATGIIYVVTHGTACVHDQGIPSCQWGGNCHTVHRPQIWMRDGTAGRWIAEELPEGLNTKCGCACGDFAPGCSGFHFISDHWKTHCNGNVADAPLSIAVSGNGQHLWAVNGLLQIFYKAQGGSWGRHEACCSPAMKQLAVSWNGQHVWAISGNKAKTGQNEAIWYLPGQLGRSWTKINEERNWLQVTISGDDNVFARDSAQNIFYVSWDGNRYDLQPILHPANTITYISAYTLTAGELDQYEFNGEWKDVGTGVSGVQFSASITWQKSTQEAVTNSFTQGLIQSVSSKFSISSAVEATVTVTASQQWGQSVTNTVGLLNRETNTYSCGSMSCVDGRLFQWKLVGVSRTGTVQQVEQCHFVCIPATSRDTPKCPATYCASLQGTEACQCCNSLFGEGGNPPESPICAPKLVHNARETNEINGCIGCDQSDRRLGVALDVGMSMHSGPETYLQQQFV